LEDVGELERSFGSWAKFVENNFGTMHEFVMQFESGTVPDVIEDISISIRRSVVTYI